jgi:lauroyl/myristoyl acyltransferase
MFASRSLQIMKNDTVHSDTTPLTLRLIRLALSVIPHSVLYYIGWTGGYIHYLFAREKRRHFKRNTAPIAARGGTIRHSRAFQNHALNILEMLKALSEEPESIAGRVAFAGREHLDRSLRAGKGLILATCHFGNWELSGIALSLHGYPVTTVAGRQLTEGWSNEVKAWKRNYGITVLSPGSGYRSLYKDLRANRIVVLHMDGDLFSRGVAVQFLGTRRRFPRGPAHISRVTGAPIAFAYSRRGGRNRFEVTIETPSAAPRTEADEASITAAMIHRVEKCILAEPEQWCIFRSI